MTGLENAGQRVADEIQFTADLALVLFEHNPDAIFIVGEDGTIARVNRQAALLAGYPASELRGMSVDGLLPGTVQANHGGHRARYLEDPRVRPMGTGMDLRMRRKNGTETPVDINLSPVMLPSGLYVIATVRRRTAE